LLKKSPRDFRFFEWLWIQWTESVAAASAPLQLPPTSRNTFGAEDARSATKHSFPRHAPAGPGADVDQRYVPFWSPAMPGGCRDAYLEAPTPTPPWLHPGSRFTQTSSHARNQTHGLTDTYVPDLARSVVPRRAFKGSWRPLSLSVPSTCITAYCPVAWSCHAERQCARQTARRGGG
jgi:hypothetical protein